MTGARAARRHARPSPVTLTLIEQREQLEPGTRSRWTLALVELTAYGARTLATWTGAGPLGRLRAHRDAHEYCQRERLEPTEQLADTRKASSVRAWEHARLSARLRDEGVLPHAEEEEAG